ncbi:thermonuclease family protein [Janibacter cremeus]|uniref:Micrococcal nuclease n=1 Tax=Janibacter cremeus TaxID=1285192 RepID=A0A852VVT9_9MICO|nr:thermonuclease family protein [Janibacter cremeus]NYF97875.1 micrococcal nuclease [Janibacter cremeus]
MPSALTVVAAVTATAVAGVASAAVGLAGLGAVMSAGPDTTATVARIVDGDTLDVRYDGETHRVRLLNIDTPEIGGNGKDGECLADEATQFLKQRLPVGSSVDLEWDSDHEDRYGRQLRGVFDDEGFVNADVVRNGLAVPMHIEPNDRFRRRIDDAYAAATRSGQGLFDPARTCTLAARTDRVNDAVQDGDRADAYAEATALHSLLTDPDSFASRIMTDTERTAALGRLTTVVDGHAPGKQRTAKATPEKRRSAKSTPTKKPTPKPSPSKSPAPAPTTTTTPPATRAPAPPRTSTPPPAPRTTPAPAPTTPSAPPAPRTTSTPVPQPSQPRPENAAPCRSYAPGGKTFTYIDCDTKLPL